MIFFYLNVFLKFNHRRFVKFYLISKYQCSMARNFVSIARAFLGVIQNEKKNHTEMIKVQKNIFSGCLSNSQPQNSVFGEF